MIQNFMIEIIEFEDGVAQRLIEVKYFDTCEKAEMFVEDYNNNSNSQSTHTSKIQKLAMARYEFRQWL